MPFDFFNLSNLAFGNKLTMAFTQLERLVKDAEEHIRILTRDLDVYAKYLNKNYQLPEPTQADSGCRVDELYDIIAENVIVRDISYEAGRLYLDCAIFNHSTGRITQISGSTTLKSGYCYFNYAISNNDTSRPANFFSDKNESRGVLLFKFTVNTTNKTVKIEWSIR